MRFTVTWLRSAEDALALLWTQAADRQALADASNRIERLLRNSPLAVGRQSRRGRKLTVGPLVVFYRVSVDDCLVTITQVRLRHP